MGEEVNECLNNEKGGIERVFSNDILLLLWCQVRAMQESRTVNAVNQWRGPLEGGGGAAGTSAAGGLAAPPMAHWGQAGALLQTPSHPQLPTGSTSYPQLPIGSMPTGLMAHPAGAAYLAPPPAGAPNNQWLPMASGSGGPNMLPVVDESGREIGYMDAHVSFLMMQP